MAAKIITFTGNAVNDIESWFCRNCNKKFELDETIATKKGRVNNTSHYCIKCAKELNLL